MKLHCNVTTYLPILTVIERRDALETHGIVRDKVALAQKFIVNEK